uniref:hypothetical protein n=1 Tax=Vibrio sp. V10_P2A27P122 TaxID=1938665 RepID=UPI000B9F16F2
MSLMGKKEKSSNKEAKLKYVSFINLAFKVSFVSTLFTTSFLILGFTNDVFLLAFSLSVVSLVTSIFCGYFYNQHNYACFQLSRNFIKTDQASLHLSKKLIMQLKEMDEKVGQRGTASKYLHDKVYQRPYLKALDWCFNNLKVSKVFRKTHHLGLIHQRYNAVKLLRRNGYLVKVKKAPNMSFSTTLLRIVLVWELKRFKSLNFKRFNIYCFEISVDQHKDNASIEGCKNKYIENEVVNKNYLSN